MKKYQRRIKNSPNLKNNLPKSIANFIMFQPNSTKKTTLSTDLTKPFTRSNRNLNKASITIYNSLILVFRSPIPPQMHPKIILKTSNVSISASISWKPLKNPNKPLVAIMIYPPTVVHFQLSIKALKLIFGNHLFIVFIVLIESNLLIISIFWSMEINSKIEKIVGKLEQENINSARG